jgi:hypothetical protein
MLSCKEVTRIVASGEIDEQSPFKRMQLRMHLLMCRHCRRYTAQLRTIGAMARKAWGPQTVDQATLDRLTKAIIHPTAGLDGPDGVKDSP